MGVGNDFASHLLYNGIIVVICCINIKMTSLYFRPSKSSVPHYNFQLLFILFLYYVFCNFGGYSRFLVFHLILFHDRGTSAPPVFVSRFKCNGGNVSFIHCTGILCTAAWAVVAQCVQKPCLRHAFWNGII